MAFGGDIAFEPKTFAAGELLAGVQRAARTFGTNPEIRVGVSRLLPDGSTHRGNDTSVDQLATVCDLRTEGVSLALSIDIDSPSMFVPDIDAWVTASVDGFIDVYLTAKAVEVFRQFPVVLAQELQLVPAKTRFERLQDAHDAQADVDENIVETVARLSARLDALERQQATTLTCFLSFRFSGRSPDYASRVAKFLSLVGVQVVTGESYEPKPINEKVRTRLAAGVDFVVLIEASDGTSLWNRDEIGAAAAPVIPLVEAGATFVGGIYGNLEYIQFSEGHVEDAFIKLLEGVHYVRRRKSEQIHATDS